MTRKLVPLLALFIFWLLMSGFFTPFLMTAGAGSALVIVLIAHRIDAVDSMDHSTRQIRAGGLFAYWLWLMKEIAKSAIDVTRVTLHPKLPISPALVEFKPTQKTELGLVIHANSITLTPGTISVEVEPGRLLVHALTQEGGAGLAGSEMDQRCSALEIR